jgi:hypothetical protein
MNTSEIQIDPLLKRLHLANTRRIWRELVARAEKESWGFHDFLATLVADRRDWRDSRTARAFPS